MWDILQDLVYESQRLQINKTSKRQSKNKWKEVTIEIVGKSIAQWKNKTECSYKAEWRQDSAHFQLIAVTGYRSHHYHAVRRVEIVILYVSDSKYSFAYFTVKAKAYNVIIYHTVQLWLLFKNVISLCLNSTVEQYKIIAKLGTFLWATR